MEILLLLVLLGAGGFFLLFFLGLGGVAAISNKERGRDQSKMDQVFDGSPTVVYTVSVGMTVDEVVKEAVKRDYKLAGSAGHTLTFEKAGARA